VINTVTRESASQRMISLSSLTVQIMVVMALRWHEMSPACRYSPGRSRIHILTEIDALKMRHYSQSPFGNRTCHVHRPPSTVPFASAMPSTNRHEGRVTIVASRWAFLLSQVSLRRPGSKEPPGCPRTHDQDDEGTPYRCHRRWAGALVRAGSTIFGPQWSPARRLAHVGRSHRASKGTGG
jgi:hypothetical protein